MEKEITFQLKSYTWKELGLLYHPEKDPEAASRSLRRWVYHHPRLTTDLKALGWDKGKRLLTPRQVKIIVFHLGEP